MRMSSSAIVNNTVRHIRSFVRREGRMTASQKYALEHYRDQYGVEFGDAEIDLDGIFHRTAPRILDVGTGMGDTTIALAKAHPENDYLAVEVHRPGIGSLLREIVANGLTNVRIIDHDVIEVLQYQIPRNSLDLVYIFFPDPWPKKRHHKRRLINESFLSILGERMKPHARLFIATDWQDYAEHIMRTFEHCANFINLAGAAGHAPRPHWRPRTKFERRGHKLQHQVWDFVFARRS